MTFLRLTFVLWLFFLFVGPIHGMEENDLEVSLLAPKTPRGKRMSIPPTDLLALDLSANYNTSSTDRRLDDCERARFRVNGNELYMTGEIGGGIIRRLFRKLRRNPQVDTLVLERVWGSCNDDIMVRLGRRIHNRGLKTRIPNNGLVASGGTDLFLAGVERTIGDNACLGIHEWCCYNGKTPAELPSDHPEHDFYIEYYQDIEYSHPVDFYWLGIHAAPPDGMHWMTLTELREFDMATHARYGSGRCQRNDE